MKKVLFFSVLILGLFLFGAVAGATTVTVALGPTGSSNTTLVVDLNKPASSDPTLTIVFTSPTAITSGAFITNPPGAFSFAPASISIAAPVFPATESSTSIICTIDRSLLANVNGSTVFDIKAHSILNQFQPFDIAVTVTVIPKETVDASGGESTKEYIASGPCDNLEIIHTIKASPVYDGASTDTDIIGRVEAQEEVHLAGWSDDYTWCKIFYKDCTRIGWVPRKVLGI